MASILREEPLAEIILRKYEKPYPCSRRDLIRKLCLSIGLLQPGDSRDIIVDIFQVFLDNKGNKDSFTSEEIRKLVIAKREKEQLQAYGIAPSNIRRQLKRLKDLHLISKANNMYKITDNEGLTKIFKDRIENFYLKGIIERVVEYFEAVENSK